MSYLSEEQQQQFQDRQSISFMYQKPPGYDAMMERDKATEDKQKRVRTDWLVCSSATGVFECSTGAWELVSWELGAMLFVI
jgi:hypothetical protein